MSTKVLTPVDSSFALHLTLIPSFQCLLTVVIPDCSLGSISLPPIKAAQVPDSWDITFIMSVLKLKPLPRLLLCLLGWGPKASWNPFNVDLPSFLFFLILFFTFWLHRMAFGILVPGKCRILTRWTAREVPSDHFSFSSLWFRSSSTTRRVPRTTQFVFALCWRSSALAVLNHLEPLKQPASCVSIAQCTEALTHVSHKAASWDVGTGIVTILLMRKHKTQELQDSISSQVASEYGVLQQRGLPSKPLLDGP